MNEKQALAKMIAPGQRRPGEWLDGTIQIWVTRACDKSCFGCTQGSNLGGKVRTMPIELFEQAVKSLVGYFGVVGVFGGNPCAIPNFGEYCDVLKRHIPYSQRGIWSNNPLGKGLLLRDCFNPAVSNLNVHMDKNAYDEFKRDWPECNPIGLTEDSHHSPVYVAMRDVVKRQEDRWSLIANCDVNRRWSAMIGMFRGALRAWFCEIAAAQSMLHQDNLSYPDTGVAVHVDWWRRPMQDYREQVRKHCHECGVPLRGYGTLAQSPESVGVEFVSTTHLPIYNPKRKGRSVHLVTERWQLDEGKIVSFTDYLGNSAR